MEGKFGGRDRRKGSKEGVGGRGRREGAEGGVRGRGRREGAEGGVRGRDRREGSEGKRDRTVYMAPVRGYRAFPSEF